VGNKQTKNKQEKKMVYQRDDLTEEAAEYFSEVYRDIIKKQWLTDKEIENHTFWKAAEEYTEVKDLTVKELDQWIYLNLK
jgi:hypothetical protein